MSEPTEPKTSRKNFMTPRQCSKQFRIYAVCNPNADAKHQLNFTANFLDEFCQQITESPSPQNTFAPCPFCKSVAASVGYYESSEGNGPLFACSNPECPASKLMASKVQWNTRESCQLCGNTGWIGCKPCDHLVEDDSVVFGEAEDLGKPEASPATTGKTEEMQGCSCDRLGQDSCTVHISGIKEPSVDIEKVQGQNELSLILDQIERRANTAERAGTQSLSQRDVRPLVKALRELWEAYSDKFKDNAPLLEYAQIRLAQLLIERDSAPSDGRATDEQSAPTVKDDLNCPPKATQSASPASTQGAPTVAEFLKWLEAKSGASWVATIEDVEHFLSSRPPALPLPLSEETTTENL